VLAIAIDGVTPLMLAASKGQKAAIELLGQKGADPNVSDKCTPFFLFLAAFVYYFGTAQLERPR